MKAAEHKSAAISTIQKKSNTPFFDTEHASEQESPFFAPQEAAGTDAFFQPATRPIIQTKLTVGQPNDKYEQEADNVADKVVQRLAKSDNTNHQSPITNHQSAPSVSEASTPIIQHKTDAPEEEKLDRKEDSKEELPELQKSPVSAVGDDEGLQMKCAECEAEEESGHVQMKGNTEGVASSKIESQLNSSKGGGSPLPDETRTSMESAMGADFSNVRVHTNSSAVQMNKDLRAHAFTHGSDVYFNEGKYNPSGTEGGRLLAHELVHTVQQNGASTNSVQRTPTCPQSRARDENTRSQTSDGILPNNAVFLTNDNKLIIQDFAINSNALPIGIANTAAWQRTMSMIVGDPSTLMAVEGFTDCNGSMRENLSLRQSRVRSVINAMPPTAQARILLQGAWSATSYLASNDTVENRARNRAVVITFRSARTPRGVANCDMLSRANNLDEYLFLVRCAETRLGLTRTSDAPRMLSVLRQLYYGSGNWSNSPNAIWDDVINDRPWSEGDNPERVLGSPLFNALKASQVVTDNGVATDIGHLLSGMDAMRQVHDVSATVGSFRGITMSAVTSVSNDAWATWAGDVGSAAAEYTVDVAFLNLPQTYLDYYQQYASNSDMEGNIDGFTIWTASNTRQIRQGQAFQNLVLNAPVSEVLMNYYRLTNSEEGRLRSDKFKNFVESYGGVVNGGQITNRAAFESRLLPQIREFALLFFGNLMRGVFRNAQPSSGGSSSTGTPPRSVSLGSLLSELHIASVEMTRLFVDWLVSRL